MARELSDKIKNKSPEEQVKILTKVLDQMQPKLRKTVSFGAPLIIQSGKLSGQVGVLLDFLCPLEGEVIGGIALVDKRKGDVRITVSIIGDLGARSKTLVVARRSSIIHEGEPIHIGERLVVAVDADQPEELGSVWITVAIKITMPASAMAKLVIGDLEQIATGTSPAPTTTTPTTKVPTLAPPTAAPHTKKPKTEAPTTEGV